jgi:ABC-type sugar transport system substrate-binding protein
VQSAQDLLSANPDAKGVITFHDYQFSPVAQALKNSTRFKDVNVYGFYAGGDTLGALRDPESPARAVADSPVADSSWVAIDALVRYFTNETPMTTTNQSLRPYPTTLLTDENVQLHVPAEAEEYPFPDPETFYEKLWRDQGFQF